MGNAGAKAREVKGKPKTGKSVVNQKISTAAATGVLSLKSHKLNSVPESLMTLVNLKVLDLSINSLKSVPAEVQFLVKLKTLSLNQNQITSLPSLSHLSKLQTLNLDDNLLEELPDLPESLTKLSLRSNRMAVIPQGMCKAINLQVVDLSSNLIVEIPAEISFLRALETLNLDNNKLMQVPSALAKCLKLKTLSLKNNVIVPKCSGEQSIAPEVLAQSFICILNLHNNTALHKLDLMQMTGIDEFMERRKKLKDKEIQGGLQADVSICGLD